MKKTLFLITLIFTLTACFNKEKALEEETTPAPAAENPVAEAPAENPAEINLNDQTPGGQILNGKLDKAEAKKLGVKENFPIMMLPRNIFGIQEIVNMMSVKGRANLQLTVEKKLLSKKKQFFVVVADNQNSLAAINMITAALQNCQSDSNAAIGVMTNEQVQFSEQFNELQDKCNTKVYTQQAQAQQ